jgi:integrase
VAKRWTAGLIKSLKPHPIAVTDPAERGLQILVRKRKSDNKVTRTWVFRYRFRGVPKRIVLGHYPATDLAAARVEARRLHELATKGIDPQDARPKSRAKRPEKSTTLAPPKPGDKHSIEFLVSEFMERHVRPQRKRPEYAEAILAKDVVPEWAGRDARTITPREVVELLDKIADRAPVMANRVAALLGQLFKFGIHRAIVETTPVQLLYRPGGKEKARERTLTDDELAAFLRDPVACTRFERLAHVLTLLLLTGQRRGELALARWSDIDFKARTWTIPDENAKGGRGHVLPLSDWAVEEFKALKREAEGSPFVLPADNGKGPLEPRLLTRGVARCLKRFKEQGVAAFTLHDLRRTCRTGLSALKVEPHIAERVLNHAQDKIAGTYDRHAYLDEKRAALDKWAAHLKKAI